MTARVAIMTATLETKPSPACLSAFIVLENENKPRRAAGKTFAAH
jgi:hypothetical protein